MAFALRTIYALLTLFAGCCLRWFLGQASSHRASEPLSRNDHKPRPETRDQRPLPIPTTPLDSFYKAASRNRNRNRSGSQKLSQIAKRRRRRRWKQLKSCEFIVACTGPNVEAACNLLRVQHKEPPQPPFTHSATSVLGLQSPSRDPAPTPDRQSPITSSSSSSSYSSSDTARSTELRVNPAFVMSCNSAERWKRDTAGKKSTEHGCSGCAPEGRYKYNYNFTGISLIMFWFWFLNKSTKHSCPVWAPESPDRARVDIH